MGNRAFPGGIDRVEQKGTASAGSRPSGHTIPRGTYAFLIFVPQAGRTGPPPSLPSPGGEWRRIMKKVAVIMGSDSDLPVVEKAFAVLKEYGIPFEAHVMSAHRTPSDVASFVGSARENGFGVIIACAGMAAHLAGVCAAATTLPVIGVPVKGGMLDGLDALLSTVQMPTGIPVATVAMNGAANAAILAAEILALSDEALASALSSARAAAADKVRAKDAALQEKI